ncbi:hypothetical protein NN561_007365 [Cricetulus griseus]
MGAGTAGRQEASSHLHAPPGPTGTRAPPLTSTRACRELAWDGDCGGCPGAGRVSRASVRPLQPGRRWLLRKAPALGDGGTRLGGARGLVRAVPPLGSLCSWSDERRCPQWLGLALASGTAPSSLANPRTGR